MLPVLYALLMWVAALQGISLLGRFIILMPEVSPRMDGDAITLRSRRMLFILAGTTDKKDIC
jgi:hypothetical protein